MYSHIVYHLVVLQQFHRDSLFYNKLNEKLVRILVNTQIPGGHIVEWSDISAKPNVCNLHLIIVSPHTFTRFNR